MRGEHVRARRLCRPLPPQQREVVGPDMEISDVAGNLVGAQPPRSGLPAPVGRGDRPAFPCPVVERLEILLVAFAAAGQEQDRALRARRNRPVDPPDLLPVGRLPERLGCIRWNGAPVENAGPAFV